MEEEWSTVGSRRRVGEFQPNNLGVGKKAPHLGGVQAGEAGRNGASKESQRSRQRGSQSVRI